MQRILVCTDGEEHSIKAEAEAILIAQTLGTGVTGLYVLSPYLKKFTHEIYAVGRNECCDHLDRELYREGSTGLKNFSSRCATAGLECITLIRNGYVAEEILAEASSGEYRMLVMGAKLLATWRERMVSVNVPAEVFRKSTIPMLFVR
ncbi:MAG: universal stress protein [Desulfomicrobium sp.]|nr:universal stress protein [Desulfomicrobium sp.]